MSKIKEFISTLNRSTRITLLSCICFVLLTLLILTFFILFPITPSEKIMASIGRENIFSGNDNDPDSKAAPPAVTTSADPASTSPRSSNTKPVSTTTRTYKIIITTGSGFSWNGRIPTGYTGYETATTPAYDDPPYPTEPAEDPGYIPPLSSTPPEDPNVGDVPGGSDIPPSSEPVVPPVDNPPVVDIPSEGGDAGSGGGDTDAPSGTQ